MKKSILAWILIACLSLMGTAALAEGASEKTWEEAIGDYYANYALTMEANSPKVTTLENGVKIQRTPADYLAHNTRILNADQRGCAACHPNLNDTVVNMKDFEEKLKKLEELSTQIRKNDISLEDALKSFEEGIKLAKGLEKELSSMESKIQILMNSPSTDDTSKKQAKDESPVLDLFNEETQINGTRS